MGTRRMCVSVVSLVPWSLGPEGPRRARELAGRAGFDGLQILPLSGWTPKAIRAIPERKVVAYREPWGGQGSLRRHLGWAGQEQSLLWDWLLFRGRLMNTASMTSTFPKALRIVHNKYLKGDVYEINPEWGLPKSIFQSLAWDTSHVRRAPWDGGTSPLGHWRHLLASLQPEAVKLILVHPTEEETGKLLACFKNELTDMLKELGRRTSAQVVLEVAPRFHNLKQERLIGFLCALRARVEEIII